MTSTVHESILLSTEIFLTIYGRHVARWWKLHHWQNTWEYFKRLWNFFFLRMHFVNYFTSPRCVYAIISLMREIKRYLVNVLIANCNWFLSLTELLLCSCRFESRWVSFINHSLVLQISLFVYLNACTLVF